MLNGVETVALEEVNVVAFAVRVAAMPSNAVASTIVPFAGFSV